MKIGLYDICITTARNKWAQFPYLSWDEMQRIARKAAIAGSKASDTKSIVDRVSQSFESQFQSKSRIGRGTERERLIYFIENWP